MIKTLNTIPLRAALLNYHTLDVNSLCGWAKSQKFPVNGYLNLMRPS